MNKFIFADYKKCIGCLNCELACAASHADIGLDEAYELKSKGANLIYRNLVVKGLKYSAPMQCMQCEDAPCLKACPIEIIKMEKGFVKIYEDDCIGCRSCAMVCPFGAISMSPRESLLENLVAIKCDLCGGEDNKQACVEVCPTDAINLIDYQTYRELKLNERAKQLDA